MHHFKPVAMRAVVAAAAAAMLAVLAPAGATAAPATAAAAVHHLTPTVAPAKSAPVTAAADDDVSWAVQPSSAKGPDGRDTLTYELKPGESVTDYVGVSNFGKKPLKMRVYAMDAMMTADGAFTLPPAGTPNKSVGGWVGLTGGGVYEIAPGKRLDIPFRLAVPTTAAPGDHAGGIVASLSEPVSSGEGDQRVAVDRRVGVRIYVRVPGDRNPALTVSDVQVDYSGGWNPISGSTTVSYTVANTGNIRLAGTANVALDGIAGWHLGNSEARAISEILPGGAVRFSETFTGVFPAVNLTAKVTVDPVSVGDAGDDVGLSANQSGSTLALPYLIIAAIVLLLGLIFFLWWRGRRWRRKAKAAAMTGATTGAEAASASSQVEPATVGAAGDHSASRPPENDE